MATIRERLAEDMKRAMRERAELRLSTLRMIRAEIVNKDKERGEEASEEEIVKILQSMVRKREEAADQYLKGGRADLAAKEREEIRILEDYLPAQMSDEELEREVESAVAETQASSMRDMGKLMGVLTRRLAGRAAPARIGQAVKRKLGG
jgi:uncharacterized protein YqeY